MVLHRFNGLKSFGISGPASESTSMCSMGRGAKLVRTLIDSENPPFERLFQMWPFISAIQACDEASQFGSRCGIDTNSLTYLQVRHYPVWADLPDMISMFSIDVSVCQEPLGLFVTMQEVLYTRTWDFFQASTAKHPADLKTWELDPLYPSKLCAHWHLLHFLHPLIITYLPIKGKAWLSSHCDICKMYWTIDLHDLTNSRPFVFLTR